MQRCKIVCVVILKEVHVQSQDFKEIVLFCFGLHIIAALWGHPFRTRGWSSDCRTSKFDESVWWDTSPNDLLEAALGIAYWKIFVDFSKIVASIELLSCSRKR